MNKNRLDKAEKEVLTTFEQDELKSTLTAARIQLIKDAAAKTIKKDKRINIRISGRDLDAIQRRSLEEGIPYQTLVSSVLHKYVSGSLQDITANKSNKRTQ